MIPFEKWHVTDTCCSDEAFKSVTDRNAFRKCVNPLSQWTVSNSSPMRHSSWRFQQSLKILFDGLVSEISTPKQVSSLHSKIAILSELYVLCFSHLRFKWIHLLKIQSGRSGIGQMSRCMKVRKHSPDALQVKCPITCSFSIQKHRHQRHLFHVTYPWTSCSAVLFFFVHKICNSCHCLLHCSVS